MELTPAPHHMDITICAQVVRLEEPRATTTKTKPYRLQSLVNAPSPLRPPSLLLGHKIYVRPPKLR